MLEIEQTISPISAPRVMSIDKSFILNELKNLLGKDSEFAPCEPEPMPNSLDYHVDDKVEIVQEIPSPAGY